MNRRDRDRRLLPRFNAPVEARQRYAVDLYRDGFRASDIAAVCKLSNRMLTLAVRTAGLRARRNRESQRSLLPLVEAARSATDPLIFAECFDLTPRVARLILVLSREGAPIAPHLTRPKPDLPPITPPPPPIRRCQSCGAISRHADGCERCGAPW